MGSLRWLIGIDKILSELIFVKNLWLLAGLLSLAMDLDTVEIKDIGAKWGGLGCSVFKPPYKADASQH